MKKLSIVLLCVLLAGLCACGLGELEEETSTMPTTAEIDPSELALYADVLNPLSERDYNELWQNRYTLYDLDGDGTKELLLGEYLYLADEVTLLSVYSIQDGVAVYQKGFFRDLAAEMEFSEPPGTISVPVLYKNGTIRMGDYGYYRLENGVIKNTIVLEEDGICYSHIINNPYPPTPITKEEFDRIRKEFEGDGQVVELDWKTLAEYGR